MRGQIHRWGTRLLLLAALVLMLCAGGANAGRFEDLTGPYAPVIRDALAQKGLAPGDITFDLHDRAFFGGDLHRLPFFDALIANPWKIPEYVPTIREGVFAAAGSGDIAGLIQQAQARLNLSVRVGLIGEPLEDYTKLLADEAVENHFIAALKRLYAERKLPLSPSEEEYLAAKSAELPEPVARAAALYLYALPDILAYHDAAMAPVKAKLQTSSLEDPVAGYMRYLLDEDEKAGPEQIARSTGYDELTEFLLANLDWGYLHTGSMVLGHVVNRMRDDLKEYAVEEGGFSLTFDTPLGMIVLNGSEADSYGGAMPYLLIIDTGGDDSYLGGAANVNSSNPSSVLIDLAGDDTYECGVDDIPSFGSGVFGYGMLVDLAGDDLYTARHCSQGSGLFGVGLLLDESGKDSYSVITEGQAAGTFGTGILADLAGDDIYECYRSSQGYGFTLGSGLLVDLGGNDRYIANDTDIKFPSAQSSEHNSSLAQGFGFGARRDFTTGHSWAGGVGMLFDAAGNDHYSCGVFGQGAGYWYGTGILSDAAGDDEYVGHWYVQASAAHFAIGVLDDSAGDDSYFADMNMAIGAGHDFSLGFLLERAGNDTYSAPNLSLGGGNASGIGVFWDFAGDDTYAATGGTTLGRGNNGRRGGLRDHMRVIGVFIDTGGADTYPAGYDFAGNNRMWTQEGANTEDPLPLAELGVGVDGEVAIIQPLNPVIDS